MRARILRVTLTVNGTDVVLDEGYWLKVSIQKAALGLMNRAVIEVANLPKTLREQLLSQFSLWQRRVRSQNPSGAASVPVKIEAGYSAAPAAASPTASGGTPAPGTSATATAGSSTPSVVYIGEISTVTPVSGPPDTIVSIECLTQSVDRTQFISSPAPENPTFSALIMWANRELELSQPPIIETRYANVNLGFNPARSMIVRSAIVPFLNSVKSPEVGAFIDDGQLIVKDADAIINPADAANVTDFIGIPMWDEWGVNFTSLFDPSIKLAHAANLTSIMNPAVNGQYVLTTLEYNLASRETPFYVRAYGSPPA
ncbi:hypothetical protein [Burkholderia phage vB_BglM_WTB]